MWAVAPYYVDVDYFSIIQGRGEMQLHAVFIDKNLATAQIDAKLNSM
jgi:hypothetical protein